MWTPKFEVAFDVDPGDEPLSEDWTDLSSHLRATGTYIETVYGRSHGLSGWETGTAFIRLDDRDRELDPTNPSATYNLVPIRHARLTITTEETEYPLFRGFVKAWPPVWTRDDATIEVKLVDGFQWLGMQDADLDLDEQKTHERITAILDAAGWPSNLRDVGDGVVDVEEFEQDGVNLLRMLTDTADSEDGDVYCAPDGKVTFRSRHSRFDQTATDLTKVADLQAHWDDDDLINVGRVEKADGTVWEVVDDPSTVSYGRRVRPVRDLPLRAAEAEGLAQWMVYRYSEPTTRATAELNGLHDGVLPLALEIRPGDLVGAGRTVPHSFDFEGMVERVVHKVTKAEWRTTLELSPYFGTSPWLTLDDSTLGVLGETAGNKIAP